MPILIALCTDLGEKLATYLPINLRRRITGAAVRDLSMLVVERFADFRVMGKDGHLLAELTEVVDDNANVWVLCGTRGTPFAEGWVAVQSVVLLLMVFLLWFLVVLAMFAFGVFLVFVFAVVLLMFLGRM